MCCKAICILSWIFVSENNSAIKFGQIFEQAFEIKTMQSLEQLKSFNSVDVDLGTYRQRKYSVNRNTTGVDVGKHQ